MYVQSVYLQYFNIRYGCIDNMLLFCRFYFFVGKASLCTKIEIVFNFKKEVLI